LNEGADLSSEQALIVSQIRLSFPPGCGVPRTSIASFVMLGGIAL
jgi:hypothetical protein